MKHTEETLLALTNGETFYHINPYGREGGKLPEVVAYVKLSVWEKSYGSYRCEVLTLYGVDLENQYNDYTYVSDLLRDFKGTFSTITEALDYASQMATNKAAIQDINQHHKDCRQFRDPLLDM